MKKCADISKEATPEVTKRGANPGKSLKKNTSSQELPRALTSLNQMKQTR
jgi:hypothetical protein